MTLSATWIKDSWGFRPSLPYTGGSGFGGSGLGTGSGGIGRGSGSYLIAVPPFESRSCQQLRKGSWTKKAPVLVDAASTGAFSLQGRSDVRSVAPLRKGQLELKARCPRKRRLGITSALQRGRSEQHLKGLTDLSSALVTIALARCFFW